MKGVSNYKLRVYKEVAELLSFTDASISLGISQATVSKIVYDLEDEFGEKLIDRTTVRVELTPAGRIVLQYACDALNLEDRTRFELILMDEEMSGTISVGFENRGLFLQLDEVMHRFTKMFDRIKLRIVIDEKESLSSEFGDDVLDLLFLKGSMESAQFDDQVLFVEPVSRDVLLVARRDNRAANVEAFINYLLKSKL